MNKGGKFDYAQKTVGPDRNWRFPPIYAQTMVDLVFESVESVNGNVTIFSFLSSIGALIGILTKIITF